MRRTTNRHIVLGMGIIAFLGLITTATWARQGNSAPQKNDALPRIGQFKIDNPNGDVEWVGNAKSRVQQLELVGKPQVTITSARYDVVAQKITLSIDSQTNVVTVGNATGNVRVLVREPERNIELTCNAAVYRFATAQAPTHIDLQGSVRAVMRSKLFTANGPLILTGENGVVEFPDKDTTRIKMKSPTATGTPIEPESKPTPKKTNP